MSLHTSFKSFLTNENGSVAVEYSIVTGFVSMMIVAGTTAIGLKFNQVFTFISTFLNS